MPDRDRSASSCALEPLSWRSGTSGALRRSYRSSMRSPQTRGIGETAPVRRVNRDVLVQQRFRLRTEATESPRIDDKARQGPLVRQHHARGGSTAGLATLPSSALRRHHAFVVADSIGFIGRARARPSGDSPETLGGSCRFSLCEGASAADECCRRVLQTRAADEGCSTRAAVAPWWRSSGRGSRRRTRR